MEHNLDGYTVDKKLQNNSNAQIWINSSKYIHAPSLCTHFNTPTYPGARILISIHLPTHTNVSISKHLHTQAHIHPYLNTYIPRHKYIHIYTHPPTELRSENIEKRLSQFWQSSHARERKTDDDDVEGEFIIYSLAD